MRRYICILFVFTSSYALAQSPAPWWVSNPAADTATLQRHALADSILNFAYTFKGVPYVWGGNTPDSGFDCSGFVCYVYKEYGIPLPRTSGLLFDAGKPVPYTAAEKGDLILFTGMETAFGIPGHVGIVISRDETGFTFIHTASVKTGGVHISHSTEPTFTDRFLEIRRVLGVH